MEFKDTEICPKCGDLLVKQEGMFFLEEAGSMPGMICEKCNALYESKEWLAALSVRVMEAINDAENSN